MEVSGPEDDPLLGQLHRVQCPVCQQAMPAAHINAHLDRCLLLHPAGLAEPAQPRAKRRRPSESSALKQPATPTAAESSEGEAEEPDDGGESEDRESDDAPPTPSGARLLPDFPGARPSSPGGKGAGPRPAAAAAAGGASPRSWGEAEAPEEEEAAGDADGEDDAGRWDADAGAAAFGAPGGRPRAPAAEEVRQLLEGKPLADTMRPDALQDFVGQGRAVGPETLLRSLLEASEVPSLILWGPPGCGKVSAPSRPSAGGDGGGPIRAREASRPALTPWLLVARFSGKGQVAGSSFPFGSVSIQFWKKKMQKILNFCCASLGLAVGFLVHRFVRALLYQTLKLYLLNRADLRTPSLCKSVSSTVFHSFL